VFRSVLIINSNRFLTGLESREYGRTDFFFYFSYIVWRRAREPILPVSGYSY
jgi:hypothetical protein